VRLGTRTQVIVDAVLAAASLAVVLSGTVWVVIFFVMSGWRLAEGVRRLRQDKPLPSPIAVPSTARLPGWLDEWWSNPPPGALTWGVVGRAGVFGIVLIVASILLLAAGRDTFYAVGGLVFGAWLIAAAARSANALTTLDRSRD
jgi:hypothetical protein